MKLEPLIQEQCETTRKWRNTELEIWRTPFVLTEKMQSDFYNDIVSNRDSDHRYWAIIEKYAEVDDSFIGMGGITYIQWENSIGEITLIIDPNFRNNGNGEKAVDLLLDQAFNYLNLQTVFGECYGVNNGTCSFWKVIVAKYNGYTTTLPNRKYWNGEYHNSLYFSIDKDEFNNSNK